MPTYEYVCLACERTFEEQRSMSATVETALACPSCASDRVRRRFSFVAQTAPGATGSMPSGGGGGCCGGACGCG